MWWRLRGGGELVGVQAGRRCCSGAWEHGEGKRRRGIGCWGICSACAHVKRGRRPQPWPGHSHGEVATMRRLWAAWQGKGSSSAQPKAVEEQQLDAWAPARCRTWPGGLSTAPATLHSGGGREKQRKGAGGGRKGLFCNFQKFQGPECKIRITFKLKLK